MKFSTVLFLLKGIIIIFLCFSPILFYAQVPQGIPNENTPTDWSSWSSRIMYIILQVLLILFVVFRKKLVGKKER